MWLLWMRSAAITWHFLSTPKQKWCICMGLGLIYEHCNFHILRLATKNAIYKRTVEWSATTGRCGVRTRLPITIAGHLEWCTSETDLRSAWFGGQSKEVRHGTKHSNGFNETNTGSSPTGLSLIQTLNYGVFTNFCLLLSTSTVGQSTDTSATATSIGTYVQVNFL